MCYDEAVIQRIEKEYQSCIDKTNRVPELHISPREMQHVRLAKQEGRRVTVMFNGAPFHPVIQEVHMGVIDWQPKFKGERFIGFGRGF